MECVSDTSPDSSNNNDNVAGCDILAAGAFKFGMSGSRRHWLLEK